MVSPDAKDVTFIDTEKSEELYTLKTTKSLMIRKTEIMAGQYDHWYHHAILLLSAFICGYGYGLDGNVRYIYTSYAASSYSDHSLISTITIITAVIGAASQLIFARLSDVFGRLSLFITAIVFYVIGTIIQSQATDIQRYAAGSVFWSTGYVGILLMLVLILSDFSSLKWRLLYQFAPCWPTMINTWIAGTITARAKPQAEWRWGIAMWAFIIPLSTLPIICCMVHMRLKARRTEQWAILAEEKSFYQADGLVKTLIELFWRLDVLGVLLMTTSVGCILSPLTLAGGTQAKWANSHLIGPLVLGFVLLPIFLVWESKWSKYPVVPYNLVKDRAIWGALGCQFLIGFIYNLAAGYIYTILIVAVNETVKSATVINSLSSFVSTVASTFFSIWITRCTRLKGYIVGGCGIWALAMGLFYHYRGGESAHSGIVAAMVIWGLGDTLLIYPTTISVQSVTSHDNMATVTALNYTLYRIGLATGAAVSGAIWTQTLYKALVTRLKDVNMATAAYSAPFEFILEYTWGTSERNAMMEAYREVQRYETIVALVFTVPLFVCGLCLRDPPLTDKVAQEDIKNGEYVDKSHNDPIADWFVGKWKRIGDKKD
ncbi:LANO_0C09692g1_1 [Lachancea nothofagi CBS 11611]|uniref:LANO_0C09692g1_1 n=1 Tax=Lachancea nothofagi CBS 11611 TaxID=1266666 RepID=A0A1G4JAC7_9SACH|nr:LANO_0C09692g1_1 [Lachancea nothofagi CBS 11611]